MPVIHSSTLYWKQLIQKLGHSPLAMRGYRNYIRRHTEYRVGPNSKKYTKYIQLGYPYNLAARVQDLDKINKEMVKLWER